MSRRAAGVAAATLLVCALVPAIAGAEPFVPESDSDTVEQLRARPLERTDLEYRALRSALRAAPERVPLAVAVAERAIVLARRDGDPRYLGQAAAALARWTAQVDPPEPVAVLYATLLQSSHRFDDALAVLDRVLSAHPRNPQAWLTRATILQVRGDYAGAAISCDAVRTLGATTFGDACLAELAGLQGDAVAAASRLAQLARADPGAEGWLELMQAELAERRGLAAAADRHYRRALLTDDADYVRAAYADFLLDRGRPREVLALTADRQRSDALLLRRALAWQALAAPERADAVAQLRARFAAATLRGDRVHLREQARFERQLRGDAHAALGLALANWAVQREPADARVLLESALAARDPDAAEPVVQFLRDRHLTDVRLAGSLAAVGGSP